MNKDNPMITPTHRYYDRKSSDIGYMTGHSECKSMLSPKPPKTPNCVTSSEKQIEQINIKNCASIIKKSFNLKNCPICNLLKDIQASNQLSVELQLCCHLCSFDKHISTNYSIKSDYKWCENICESCDNNILYKSVYNLKNENTDGANSHSNGNHAIINDINNKNRNLLSNISNESIYEISPTVCDYGGNNPKLLDIEYSYVIPELPHFRAMIGEHSASEFQFNLSRRHINDNTEFSKNEDKYLLINDNCNDIKNSDIKFKNGYHKDLSCAEKIKTTDGFKLNYVDDDGLIKRTSLASSGDEEELHLLKDLKERSNSSSQIYFDSNCNREKIENTFNANCTVDKMNLSNHLQSDNCLVKIQLRDGLNIQDENDIQMSLKSHNKMDFRAEESYKDTFTVTDIDDKVEDKNRKDEVSNQLDRKDINSINYSADKKSDLFNTNTNNNLSTKFDNKSTYVLIRDRISVSETASADSSVDCESGLDQARYISDEEYVEISERHSNRYHISGLSSELASQISSEEYGAVGYEIVNNNGSCNSINNFKFVGNSNIKNCVSIDYKDTCNVNVQSKIESIQNNKVSGHLHLDFPQSGNIDNTICNDNNNIKSNNYSGFGIYESEVKNNNFNNSNFCYLSKHESNSEHNPTIQEMQSIDVHKYNEMLNKLSLDCVSMETNCSYLSNIPTSCCISFKKDKTVTKNNDNKSNFNSQFNIDFKHDNSTTKSLTTLSSHNEKTYVENKNHDLVSICKNYSISNNLNNLDISDNVYSAQSPIKSNFKGIFNGPTEIDPDHTIKSTVDSKWLINSLASHIHKYNVLKNNGDDYLKSSNSGHASNGVLNPNICNDFNDNQDVILPFGDEESTNFNGQLNIDDLDNTYVNSPTNQKDYLVPNRLNIVGDNACYNNPATIKHNDNTNCQTFKKNELKNRSNDFTFNNCDINDVSNDEDNVTENKYVNENGLIKCDTVDVNFNPTLNDVKYGKDKISTYKNNTTCKDGRTSKNKRKSVVRKSIPGHRSSKGKDKMSGFLTNAKKKLMASMLPSPKSLSKASKTQHPSKLVGNTTTLKILTNEINPSSQSTNQNNGNKDNKNETNLGQFSTNKISSGSSNRTKIGQLGNINKNKISSGIPCSNNLRLLNENSNDPIKYNKLGIPCKKNVATGATNEITSKNHFQMLQQYFATKHNNAATTSVPKKPEPNIKQKNTKEEKNNGATSANLRPSNLKYKSTFSQCFSPRRSSSTHKNIVAAKKQSKILNQVSSKKYEQFVEKEIQNVGDLRKGFGSRKLLGNKPSHKEIDPIIVQSDSGDSGVGSHARETFTKGSKTSFKSIETIKEPTFKDNKIKFIPANHATKLGQLNNINTNKLGQPNYNNVNKPLYYNINKLGQPNNNVVISNKPNNCNAEQAQANLKPQSNLKAPLIHSKTKLNTHTNSTCYNGNSAQTIANNNEGAGQDYHKNANEGTQSYEMTIWQSYEDEEDSREDDLKPQQLPPWACGHLLVNAVAKQQHQILQILKFFPPIVAPNLNEIFSEHKERFDLRTSSAIWEHSMSCCNGLLDNKTIDL